MSIWATCSRLVAGAALLLGSAPPLRAQLSLQEALQAAFPPPAVVERRTAFLSSAALDSASNSGGGGPSAASVGTASAIASTSPWLAV